MALWGGRFANGPADSVAALSRSVEFDWRLAPYDIRVNLAHLDGLIAAGVIEIVSSKPKIAKPRKSKES